MALKPDRNYTDGTDISYFMNATAERGGIVTTDGNGGSGAAMDDALAKVWPTGAAVSGTIPVGLLLNDMVNLDLTRQHINWHKDEVQLGGKVTVLQRGTVVTNVIDSTSTPTNGAAAYYTSQTFNGNASVWVLSTTIPIDSGSPGFAGVTGEFTQADQAEKVYRVGKFKGVKDTDGYVKVDIDLA